VLANSTAATLTASLGSIGRQHNRETVQHRGPTAKMLSVEGVQNAISRLVVGFVVVLAVWSLSCVISLLEEDTTMGGDPKSFENSTGGANDPADEPDKDSTAPVEWGADDPFKVLGLSGGIEDNTIEDVTKVKRKLALKFHPGMHFICSMSAWMRLALLTCLYRSQYRKPGMGNS